MNKEQLLLEKLTAMERDVVACLTSGLDNRTTAEQLHLAYGTVKNVCQKIRDKLGCDSCLQIVVKVCDARLYDQTVGLKTKLAQTEDKYQRLLAGVPYEHKPVI